MDPKGMKMSKSLGNTIDPIKVMETNGADIIRLWALSVDSPRTTASATRF
jgi:isoleucyl-tRNA synthetase